MIIKMWFQVLKGFKEDISKSGEMSDFVCLTWK